MTFFKTYESSEAFIEKVLGKCATYVFDHSSEQIKVYQDLTIIDLEGLGQIQSFYRAFSVYMAEEALKVEMKLAVLKKQYKKALNEAIKEVQLEAAKGVTMTMLKAEAELDPDVDKLADDVLETEYIHKALTSREDNLERMITTISREMSRREMKHDGVV